MRATEYSLYWIEERAKIMQKLENGIGCNKKTKYRSGRIIAFPDLDKVYKTPAEAMGIGHEPSGGFCIEEFYIWDNITELYPRWACNLSSLQSIHVPQNHECFCDIDGVLFSKDKKKLITFPQGRLGDNYIVPEGTEIIGENAFERSRITEVVMPSTLKKIEADAFEGSNTLICNFLNSKCNQLGARCFKVRSIDIYVIRNDRFKLEEYYKSDDYRYSNGHSCFFVGPEELENVYKKVFVD